jgi:polyphosphate kinase 2 (PPK2 family)
MPMSTNLTNIQNSSIGKDSNGTVRDCIMRRDNEIERLRMQNTIMQQQLNSSLSKLNDFKVVNSNEQLRRDIEYEKSITQLDLESTTASNKDATIRKLESLLNEREYEISNLKQNMDKDNSKLKEELARYKLNVISLVLFNRIFQ